MLRLAGLPSAARYPHARVARGTDVLELRFSGPDGTRAIDVPLRLLEGDLEEIELRLLARLKELGYRIERAPPEPAE